MTIETLIEKETQTANIIDDFKMKTSNFDEYIIKIKAEAKEEVMKKMIIIANMKYDFQMEKEKILRMTAQESLISDRIA